jgi:hypothetical protein
MQGILELWLFNKTKLDKHLTNEKIRREVEKRPMFRYCSKSVLWWGQGHPRNKLLHVPVI